MLEAAILSIPCPECGCPMSVPLSRVIRQAGIFCPACQVHVTFADDRAGMASADRLIRETLQSLSKMFEIKIEL